MGEGKNIHAEHRKRLKKRFLETLGHGMEDYQLLELALFYSVPRKDTNPMAHELMDRFGSLAGVLQAAPESLLEVRGVGESTVVLLQLMTQLMSRYQRSLTDPEALLNTTDKLAEFLWPFFLGQRKEKVYMLCLDKKMRLISSNFMGEGSDSAVTMDVKSLVTRALSDRACAVVLSHSHPSGVALPSQEDIVATQNCQRALGTVGVKLWDHLVFADNECVSMRDSGMIR